MRQKEVYDGAAPSGNSVALYNLLRLARLTGRHEYEERAAAISSAFSRPVATHPSAFTFFLCALSFAFGDAQELVIVGDPAAPDTAALLAVANEGYGPNRVVIVKPTEDEAADTLARLAPFLADFVAIEGRATAYLCRGHACERPVTSADDLRALIEA